jgi:hypothetical protein
VRNSTDEDLGQFSVIQLGDLVIKPSNNEQEFRANLPVFNPATEDMKDRPLVITQKPLKQNEVGPAMISGITPARINIENESHEYAQLSTNGLKSSSSGTIQILWMEEDTGENKWAILLLGASGTGDSYESYFKAVDASETPDDPQQTPISKVKITSGYAVVNASAFNVIDNELTEYDNENNMLATYCAELILTGETYIYLQATYNSDTETINEPTIEQDANFPLPEDNAYKGLIAHVKWDGENNTIKKIIQHNYGVIEGIIMGEC